MAKKYTLAFEPGPVSGLGIWYQRLKDQFVNGRTFTKEKAIELFYAYTCYPAAEKHFDDLVQCGSVEVVKSR